MLGPDVRLSSLVATLPDFTRLFQVSSKQLTEFMEHIFYENEQTASVTSVPIDSATKMLVFGANSSQLNDESIAKMIQTTEEDMMRHQSVSQQLNHFFRGKVVQTGMQHKYVPVQVRIMEIGWLQNKLGALYVFMGGITEPSVYANELIRVLLGQ